MSESRIVLSGVEAQLLEVAFLERNRVVDQANAVFAQRVAPIRESHGVTDGVKAQFALEDGQAIMRLNDE